MHSQRREPEADGPRGGPSAGGLRDPRPIAGASGHAARSSAATGRPHQRDAQPDAEATGRAQRRAFAIGLPRAHPQHAVSIQFSVQL